MSKKFLLAVLVAIAATTLILAGCSSYDNDLLEANSAQSASGADKSSATAQDRAETYTVTYFADGVRNSVQVRQNDDWYVDVPHKTGYKFNGLFDRTEGGTQYVSAEGYSLAPFTDGRNVNLFAQYTPEEITVNFYNEDGSQLLGTAKVDAETRFDSIAPATLPDGTIVTAWSTEKGGEPFEEEKVLVDTDFYVRNCSYRIRLDNGFGEVKTSYVAKGEPYRLTVPERKGYGFVFWQDLDGVQYETDKDIPIEKSMTFVAKWEGNEYVVYLDPSQGALDKTTSAAVKFGDDFALPVPAREGYIFGGWYVDGERITDGKGFGLTAWNFDAAQIATARWLLQKTVFSDSTSYVITDSGRANQHMDEVQLSKLLGAPLSDYAAIGAKTVEMRFSVEIAEIEDGYQYVFLSNDTLGKNFSDELLFTECIQHGVFTVDTTLYAHEFVKRIPISQLADTFYILYGAGGISADDWNRNSIEVTFSII